MSDTSTTSGSSIAGKSPSDSSSAASWLWVCGGVVVTSTALLWSRQYYCRQRKWKQAEKEWMQRRQEERTGRIRAEVKLRTAMKQLQQERLLRQQQDGNGSSSNNKKNGSKNDKDNKDNSSEHMLLLRAIGIVASPYTKRMGTPRQAQLVPSSRGYIQFSCPAAALDGIDEYSHVYVIFGFHANTDLDNGNNNKRTKIRPPRAPGKVGQLATRSPHRPNAVGLSLVTVQRWNATTRQLHVSGLDLVHGTPVYDIKPCVPWDVPNVYDKQAAVAEALMGDASFRVPDWVRHDDALSSVTFTEQAKQGLHDVLAQGHLQPFYALSDLPLAQQALTEILAQDPRSSHKGLKTNARGSANDATPYSLVFGQCQVWFQVVVDTTSNESVVVVQQVVPFDTSSLEHVDGIPLLSSSSVPETLEAADA